MKLFIILFFSTAIIYSQSFIELGFSGSGGNSNSVSATAAANLNKKDSIMEYELGGKIIYSKANNTLGNKIYDALAKLSYNLSNRFSVFVFSSYNKNVAKQIKNKIDVGAGINYIIIHEYLEISAGVLGDFIEYADRHEDYVRLPVSLKNTNKLDDNIQNKNILSFQPNTKDKNFHVDFSSILEILLSKSLSFSNNFTLLYDNVTFNNIKKTDWNIITALKYNF